MTIDPASIAPVGAALGTPTRVEMCLMMLDGRAWTAGELAAAVGVTKSTASSHIGALMAVGLFVEERQGRHRYARLASQEAVAVIESVSAFAGRPAPVASLRQSKVRDDLVAARTCYDHIAGKLGVALMEVMVANDILSDEAGLSLTADGRSRIAETFGAVAIESPSRRPLLRTCLDWTERRHHLAGHLASVMLETMVDRRWVARGRVPRVLRVTNEGVRPLRECLGFDASAWVS